MASAIARLFMKSTMVEENEIRAVVSSFSFIFILMAAYYILRPVRDSLASDWTDAEVSVLWTINFFLSTIFVALYGWAASKIEFRRLVPGVYTLFAISFGLFYVAARFIPDTELINKSFYLWVSVFALFHVSVFWSFMADTFDREQASRVFGIIGAGASLGAIVGPLISGLFASQLGVDSLLLCSAVLLLMPLPIISYLGRLKTTELHNQDLLVEQANKPLGGSSLAGFKAFFSNPYLLGIGVFLILYAGIGSFVYLEQKNLLAPYDMETRTMIYAYRDVAVNSITYLLAFFVTGRLVSKVGMSVALPLVPILVIAGMLILAFSPVLIVAVGMHIAFKSGNYGITRPSREMLFTQVSREDRFKTKPVIDIVAFRGGDVMMGWFFTGLTQGLGLGLAAVAGVGAGIAALWALVGYLLGRKFEFGEQMPAPKADVIASEPNTPPR